MKEGKSQNIAETFRRPSITAAEETANYLKRKLLIIKDAVVCEIFPNNSIYVTYTHIPLIRV